MNISSVLQKDDAVGYYFFTVFGLITIIAVFGNIIVITTVCRHAQLRIPGNYFVVSLAISDLSFAIFYPLYNVGQIPGYVIAQLFQSSHACQAIIALVQWIELNSAYHLVAITATRYLAITKPLKYHIWMTERNSMLCIIFIWISTCAIPSSFYVSTAADTHLGLCRFEVVYPPQNALFLCFGTMVIPTIIMVTLYIFIIRIARKQVRQIIAIEMSLGIGTGKFNMFRREMKSAMAVSLLVGWFVVAWSPLAVYIIYSTVCKCESNLYVRTTCRLIVYTNYAVNVFIYSGRMKEFRKCVCQDFRCLCDKVKGLSIERVSSQNRPTICRQ